MGKSLVLDFISDEDECGCSSSEEVRGVSDAGTKINFYVHDLDECPEDAILGRDLFSGFDFIEALELGMKLAQEGYTEILLNLDSEKEE